MKNSINDHELSRRETGIYRIKTRSYYFSHLGLAINIVEDVDNTTTVIVDNTFKDTLFFYCDLEKSTAEICNNIISDRLKMNGNAIEFDDYP